MSTWKLLEFLLAVHKAVEKVGINCVEEVAEMDSPAMELFSTYKKCLDEIEAALEEVLLRGLAVDEIRQRPDPAAEFLRVLMGEDSTPEE